MPFSAYSSFIHSIIHSTTVDQLHLKSTQHTKKLNMKQHSTMYTWHNWLYNHNEKQLEMVDKTVVYWRGLGISAWFAHAIASMQFSTVCHCIIPRELFSPDNSHKHTITARCTSHHNENAFQYWRNHRKAPAAMWRFEPHHISLQEQPSMGFSQNRWDILG